MTIGDLTYSLGAEWDEGSLKGIENGFKNVAKGFMTAVGVASGAMAGTFAVVKEFAEANDELGKMARNRDIAVDSLQALQYSFEGAGLAGSKAGDVLEALQQQKEKFKTGKADYEAFDRIGVNPNAYSNTEDYFNAVIDGLGNLKDEATKADLAKRLLGSSDMKNLIDGGSEAIKKQKAELKELGVLISNQDYKESADFNGTLLKTMTILKGLANKVMTSIMPIFTKLMKQFNSFIDANKELLSSGLKTFLNAIIDGSTFFLSLIGRIIEHLGGLKVIVAVISGLLLFWYYPIILITAGILALMLIFDDVMSFFKGEDSLIADWLGVDDIDDFKNQFPKITAVAQAVVDTMIGIFTYFKDTFFNIWDLVTGAISFDEALSNQVETINNFLESIGNIFNDFVTWIVSLFDSIDLFGGIKDQINDIKDTVSSFIPDMPSLENVTSTVTNMLPSMDSLSSFMGFPTAPAPQPVLAQASPQREMVDSSQTTTNTYHISASVDAKNKSISEAIQEITNPSGY